MKRNSMLARVGWFVFLALGAALVPQKARAVDGSQIVPGGGEITYTGATEVSWVNNPDGSQDFLIKYSDPSVPGTFTFPGMTKARILAVGGGGGGAGAYGRAKAPHGGGGGGGAGGLIETNGMFGAASFTLTVGSGGEAGKQVKSSIADATGSNGGNTVVMMSDVGWLTAVGGGGGGSNSEGKSGGSGGGGSRISATGANSNGGSGMLGLGFDGGLGDADLFAGGGGGAGAAGSPGSTSEGGKGGDGIKSDITGEEVWYAGGGAGGCISTATTGSAITGGLGGGGSGGYGKAVTPKAGTNGLGGGGGGCNGLTFAGAAGGSGVVVVRIAGSISGGLTKPTDVAYACDGKPHTSYETTPFYTVEGKSTGTEIGVYPVVVKPVEGIKWTDGSSDAVAVTMTIYDKDSQSGTATVTGYPVKYVGAAEVTWVNGDLLLKFTGAGSFTLPGTTKARVLAVGGGGGGAGAYGRASSPVGGGGGGGAGGFLETDSMLEGASYAVGVGVGGAAGIMTKSSVADATGASGGTTFVYKNASEWLTAYGGGGGGSSSAGKNGGSGGGGSQTNTGVASAGGQGIEGQGHDGGAGAAALWGGGGGGAGESGGAATTSRGGKGGAGKASNITGEEVWYAGGGSGGSVDKSVKTGNATPGGQGGGGAGGYGIAATPTAGTDGLGGGGGGCSAYNYLGGKGGSGVVYVRISATMEGELKKPAKIQEYTYDGNAHTSVLTSAFYDLTGDNVGTDVGEYKASVSLKPGFSWPGGDTESPIDVTMTIKPQKVEITSLTMANWEYTVKSAERPDPVCVYTPTWVKLVYEYATKQDAAESEWTDRKPIDVGSYWIRARLPDTKNYEGTTAYAQFSVNKRKVTFSDLFQKDWMEGTPDEATPRPRCTVDPDWVEKVYQYAEKEDSPEEDWKSEKPTTIGTWAIRVSTPNKKNYDYEPITSTFAIVKGRGGTFIDYVEITIDGWQGTDPAELTNFPYKITLSEETPYGFLYSRAGEDGNELGVTDAKGDDLLYRVEDWNIHGESEIYVRVPLIGKDPQVIRLYWKLRPGATAPEHNPELVFEKWSKKQVEAMTVPEMAFDLVVRDGYRVNYWVTKPNLTPTVWTLGKTPGVLTPGQLAESTYVTTLIDSVSGSPATFPPTKVGAYRYLFTLQDPEMEYEPLEAHIDFAVTGSTSMDDLQGDAPSLTANGRVMLANDDSAPGHEVSGQSYWRTDPETQPIFWVHSGSHSVPAGPMPNLAKYPGSIHRLYSRNEDGTTNLLWRMEDVILGNTFKDASSFGTTRCFLPWSSTSLGMSSEKAIGGTFMESGWMVFRNTTSATIYSPCYTNGIGTIYFDAVNGTMVSSSSPAENYAIVLEVATNVYDEAGHSLPPTDENCRGIDEYGKEDEYGRLREERWTRVSVIPLKRDKNKPNFERLNETDTIPLSIEGYGTTNNFFRICAVLDYRDPVRFRIRRVGTADGVPDLMTTFILVDNILVSYPKSTGDLRPLGKFDPEKGGKDTLGQEGAFSVPFPAVNETSEVYGGATNDIYLSGAAKVDPRSVVLLSRMHYRWRYANQASNDWLSVDLSPFDNFHATTPLKLPYDEGDLEFFYESFMNVPFYKYYDYSGAGVGLSGLYTEETGTVTNRLNRADYARFAGPGDDWFVRFRAGMSDWDEMRVFLTGAYAANQTMELIGDHTWRGLVKVPTNATGMVKFSFIGGCRRSAWGALEESDIWWYPSADVDKMPGRGEMTPMKTEFGYRADGASNYIEFQFNDETHAFTVGHAEYQTFNLWHDAHREDGKFVGTYAETSGVSVTEMVQTNAHMHTWSLHRTTDENWNESFAMQDYSDPTYPKYTDTYLLTHKMPHQWNGENGIFVDANLTKSNATEKSKNSGIAWQMRGKGLGNVSFTANDTPSGIDTVSFKARLAQTIGFNDFSFWEGDGSTTAKNYTFVVPALMSTANYGDCSPGSTMSVVGYYRARSGCYEFRIERPGSDGMLFSIYKWTVDGDEVIAELLGRQWYGSVAFAQNTTTQPNMYAMFISVGEEVDGGTTIIGGLCQSAGRPNLSFSSAGSTQYKYRTVCCVDNSKKRHVDGAFGVLSSNCNGWYLTPRHWTSNIAKSTLNLKTVSNPDYPMYKGYNQDAIVTYPGTVIDDSNLVDPDKRTWAYTAGRCEYLSWVYDNSFVGYGMRAPASLNQTVGVYLKPVSGGSWSLYDSVTVNKYGFNSDPFTVTVRTNVDCHVMLKTGSKATDVTVWQIAQTGWSGEDIANISGLARDFVYTQARVVDEVTSSGTGKVTNRFCVLQPSRVKEDMPLSIRSPLLKGLGMVGFSYKDVKQGAEVWVQIATNNVSSRLNGTGGYNYSILSMDPGGDEPVGTWVTLRKYTYDELKAASSQTYYIGLHDRIDVPLEGVIRIFVPPHVYEAATAQVKKTPDYGSITITDILVHDEPALDTRSWIGWNLRTIGDSTDSELRMYLPDLSDRSGGLSAGLNNSYRLDIAGDPSEFDKVNPTIQSPTFFGQANIGQVRFRARLYNRDGAPARVALYGVSNSAKTDWGEPLTNFTVTSSRYRIFEYKAPSRKNFAAIRLAVNGVIQGETGLQRVLLDEVVVSEKNDTAVGFYYARPFRKGLDNDLVVEDILSMDQQPLSDESWGLQTKLKFDAFDSDVDFDRGFRVTMRYFVGESPWGFEEWVKSPYASEEVELRQVGAKKDYIFRSTASDRDTVVPPHTTDTVVQYAVTVYFYEKGNSQEYERTITVSEIEGDGWTNPSWYWPVDKNKLDSGVWKSDTSPYTILESISPGRAWINEVNFNDGPNAENGGYKTVTNQFIELAVPWGVDMTGWTLKLTDYAKKSTVMAVLGRNGLPASKKTDDGRRSGDYDFYVLESPETRNKGGIRDNVTGQKAADGAWTAGSLSGTFTSGTLQYDQPYQFELVRPSGIVEHQFVVGGTNEYCYPNEYYYLFGYLYDGTNLVNELNFAHPSVKRFYAGLDVSRISSDRKTLASFGVTGNAHGEEGGWSGDMHFTPGRANEGQDELSGWYIKPSGGSCWVYLRLDPETVHLSQKIGEDTSRDTFALVNSGMSTSITYTASNWYQVDKVHRIENGVTNTTFVGKTGTFTFPINTVTGVTTIVATEAIDQTLVDGGLDPFDRYTPAVMRWLEAGYADGKPFANPAGPIKKATYRGLSPNATNCVIGLKGMYLLDIDPTQGGWWLRGDTVNIVNPVKRKWYQSNGSYTPYDNVQVQVKLYLSNETDKVVYAPKRLQGPNNEKSDDTASYSSWTGVTFKVEGYLQNGEEHNVGYLPFRWFVFGPGSFAADYTTWIELIDPFSMASPGYTYGWYDYKGKGCSPWFRWNINEKMMPVGVEMLKADSTYEGQKPWIDPKN